MTEVRRYEKAPSCKRCLLTDIIIPAGTPLGTAASRVERNGEEYLEALIATSRNTTGTFVFDSPESEFGDETKHLVGTPEQLEQIKRQQVADFPINWDFRTLEDFVDRNYWFNPEDAIGDIRKFLAQQQERQTNFIAERRYGKVRINMDLFNKNPNEVAKALRGGCVTSVTCFFAESIFEYTMSHPDFDPVAVGEMIPNYLVIADRSQNGLIIRFKKA